MQHSIKYQDCNKKAHSFNPSTYNTQELNTNHLKKKNRFTKYYLFEGLLYLSFWLPSGINSISRIRLFPRLKRVAQSCTNECLLKTRTLQAYLLRNKSQRPRRQTRITMLRCYRPIFGIFFIIIMIIILLWPGIKTSENINKDKTMVL